MKKLLSGMVVLAAIVAARPAVAGPGAHLGINLADSSAAVSTSSTEFMGGVFYETSGNLLHLQPELNLIPKGFGTYLTVPVFLKAKFDAGLLKPFLLVGPSIGFKISGAGAETIDFTADGGGGLEFEVVPGIGLSVEGRYSLGFTNLVTGSPVSIKSRAIHILAGLHLDM